MLLSKNNLRAPRSTNKSLNFKKRKLLSLLLTYLLFLLTQTAPITALETPKPSPKDTSDNLALSQISYKPDPALSKIIPTTWLEFSYKQDLKPFNLSSTGFTDLKTCSTTATSTIIDRSSNPVKISHLTHTRNKPMTFEAVTYGKESRELSSPAIPFITPTYFAPWLLNSYRGINGNDGLFCPIKDLPYYATLGKITPKGQEVIINKAKFAYLLKKPHQLFMLKVAKALKVDTNSKEFKDALAQSFPDYNTTLERLELYVSSSDQVSTFTLYRKGKTTPIFTATLKKAHPVQIKPLIADDYVTLLKKGKVKL